MLLKLSFLLLLLSPVSLLVDTLGSCRMFLNFLPKDEKRGETAVINFLRKAEKRAESVIPA